MAVGQVGIQETDEPVVFVGAHQLRRFLVPLRRDITFADHAFRLNLEDVGEVGPQRDLEREPHRLHSVVLNVKVFVDALVDGPAQDQTQSSGFNVTEFGGDSRIGKIRARGVVGNSARILQNPMCSIGECLVVADVAGVVRVESLVCIRGDAAVRFSEDERIASRDGNERRADRYFNSNTPPRLNSQSPATTTSAIGLVTVSSSRMQG